MLRVSYNIIYRSVLVIYIAVITNKLPLDALIIRCAHKSFVHLWNLHNICFVLGISREKL